MKLLVRNLARTTTEEELTSFFSVFGTVQSCNLVLDKATGKSKGFAFVEMPKVGEAKAAMIKLNDKEVAGNKIRVKKAETQAANQVESKPEDTAQKITQADIPEVTVQPEVAVQPEVESPVKQEAKTQREAKPESNVGSVWKIPKK